MDHIDDNDKYDLFNAPQFVDFNQIMKNDGFEDDHADDYFETHREEDDFLPPQPTSFRDQPQLLVLQTAAGSRNKQQEAPGPAKYQPVPKTPAAGSNSHPKKNYIGTGIPMFKPQSSTKTAPTPNPSPSDLPDSNKKQKNKERENKTRLCYTVVKDTSKTT